MRRRLWTTIQIAVEVTGTYDLGNELTGSASSVGGSQPLTTTYSYDGDGGRQGVMASPTAVTSTTGRGDWPTPQVGRGRSEEQGGLTWSLANDAQDLVGGLSDLVSTGTQDYLYLQPGSGQAPVMGYQPSTSRATYLATDDLGSVRLATDPTDAVVGAGAYDAWGNAQPTLGGSGATLLAGLQASSPFGYADQQYDAGPGTYAMRARAYSPATGQFASEDPQAYTPDLPVTINPYVYADDRPSIWAPTPLAPG